MQTSAWYTSKTVWVMVIAFALNLLPQVGVPITPAIQTVGSAILAAFGIIFRWNASGPLSLSGSSS